MRWMLLLLIAWPLAMAAEQIDRISSAQQLADRYVFVSATGAGPWTLIVGVGLRPGDKSVSYPDLEFNVFDANGNKLVARPKEPDAGGWMEIGGPGRQACGIYSVGKSATGGEPSRVELKIYGKKAVFELKDRQSSSL